MLGASAFFAHFLRSRWHRCSTSRCPVTNTRMPPGGRRSCICTTWQMIALVLRARHSKQRPSYFERTRVFIEA